MKLVGNKFSVIYVNHTRSRASGESPLRNFALFIPNFSPPETKDLTVRETERGALLSSCAVEFLMIRAGQRLAVPAVVHAAFGGFDLEVGLT
ncbi:MAG TPA: hypothetical protein VGN95_21440 [Pyrinomonadaceae bacterium]|nr:hypothetical protein [Pyrinomonadaceae bacterium]